jgi:hypothetical protein
MAADASSAPVAEQEEFKTAAARRVADRLGEVFRSLEHLPFLRPADRKEFRYFRRRFHEACRAIDGRVERGEIRPWSKRSVETLTAAAAESFPRGRTAAAPEGPPRCLAIPGGALRVGVFIGSFDPFQMTHIETALRFLAHGERPADIVLIVPEGSYSKLKPGRSDYDYRFDLLRRQAEEAFRPFLLPLDIGEGQDTIGIVRRLIALFCGRELTLTHVLGSDVFPMAASWYPTDLEAWVPTARRHKVVMDFGAFVVKRDKADRVAPPARAARERGIPVQLDLKPIGTPSSTAFRERGIFTILFPTEAVLEKLEVVFRYGMHRHWLTERGAPDYEI